MLVKTRVLIWIMLCLSIMCSMLTISNINIAILSMVSQQQRSNVTNATDFRNSRGGICGRFIKTTLTDDSATNNFNVSSNSKPIFKQRTFEWDNSERNLILGSTYWFVWLASFLGGWLCHRYGPKLVLGISLSVSAIITASVPMFSGISPMVVAIVRSLDGFLMGVVVPGVVCIIGKWSPMQERGKFMSVMLANPLGSAISFPIYGYIADHLGWEFIFYTTSFVATIWVICWIYFVYDCPNQHPWIKEKEKTYIFKHHAGCISSAKSPVPWTQIITSLPFLIIVASNMGMTWGCVAVNTYAASYFKDFYGYSSEEAGYNIGLPYLLNAILSYIVGCLSDFIIQKDIMKVTNMRKLFCFFGAVVPGILLLAIPFTNCNIEASLWSIRLNIVLTSFFIVGTSTAIVDISPNFCAVLQGICNALSFSMGFLCVVTTNYVSKYYDTYGQWKFVFLLCAVIRTVPGLLFVVFGNSEVQPWNFTEKKSRSRKLKIDERAKIIM